MTKPKCENCLFKIDIMKSKANSTIGVGSVTEIFGYGCTFLSDREIIFMENDQDRCEEHVGKN